MPSKITQKLKRFSLFDYFIFLIIILSLISSFGAFGTGDISTGFDKLTIAILFVNMILANYIQRDYSEIVKDYKSISDLKSEIIGDQEHEIEELRQENAKLKADWDLIK